jgi:hypothetical protein
MECRNTGEENYGRNDENLHGAEIIFHPDTPGGPSSTQFA